MKEHIDALFPFYQFAIEQVSVGIHAIDVNGHTVLYNEKMKEMEGFHFNDLTDRSIIDLFSFQQQESTLLRVLHTGTKELHVKQNYQNKDGHEITTINDTYPIFQDEKLIGAIEFARDITSLEKLIYQPLHRYEEPLTFESITAVSKSMRTVITTAKKAAQAKLPVLLIGESGTGKDLIAEGIHHYLPIPNDEFVILFSRRTDQSIIEQLHSYLIEKKSYTFFFERIEFLSLAVQQELLETLKTLPSSKHMIIGSIGSDPIDLIANGQLLKSFYYYFASMSINIPSLSIRKEDILPFVLDYFERHRKRFASHIEELAPDVKELFLHYNWPGNLKELELLLDEIATMITTEKVITLDMLPFHFRFKVQQQDGITREPEFFMLRPKQEIMPLEDYLREAENYYVQNVLQMHDGNITKAAAALGMSRQNLQYRIRKMKNQEGE